MRPVRLLAALVFAVAVTGCTAYSAADHPTQAPAAPVADQAPTPPVEVPAPAPRSTPAPTPPVDRVVTLADGHYDAYIRHVQAPAAGGRGRLVVDLVQILHDRAAVDAAVADGQPRDTARYLTTWVRNQNPRLRTLALAGDARVELLGGDCGAPLGHQLSELARHASSSDYHYYYALTVTGGAVLRVQELRTGNAC